MFARACKSVTACFHAFAVHSQRCNTDDKIKIYAYYYCFIKRSIFIPTIEASHDFKVGLLLGYIRYFQVAPLGSTTAVDTEGFAMQHFLKNAMCHTNGHLTLDSQLADDANKDVGIPS